MDLSWSAWLRGVHWFGRLAVYFGLLGAAASIIALAGWPVIDGGIVAWRVAVFTLGCLVALVGSVAGTWDYWVQAARRAAEKRENGGYWIPKLLNEPATVPLKESARSLLAGVGSPHPAGYERPVAMLDVSAKAGLKSKITKNLNGRRLSGGRLETITLEEPIWVQFQYSLQNSGEMTSHSFPGLRLLAASQPPDEPIRVQERKIHYEVVTWKPRRTGGKSQKFPPGKEIELPARGTVDVKGRVWFDVEGCRALVDECVIWFEIAAEIVGQEPIVRRLRIIPPQQS